MEAVGVVGVVFCCRDQSRMLSCDLARPEAWAQHRHVGGLGDRHRHRRWAVRSTSLGPEFQTLRSPLAAPVADWAPVLFERPPISPGLASPWRKSRRGEGCSSSSSITTTVVVWYPFAHRAAGSVETEPGVGIEWTEPGRRVRRPHGKVEPI